MNFNGLSRDQRDSGNRGFQFSFTSLSKGRFQSASRDSSPCSVRGDSRASTFVSASESKSDAPLDCVHNANLSTALSTTPARCSRVFSLPSSAQNSPSRPRLNFNQITSILNSSQKNPDNHCVQSATPKCLPVPSTLSSPPTISNEKLPLHNSVVKFHCVTSSRDSSPHPDFDKSVSVRSASPRPMLGFEWSSSRRSASPSSTNALKHCSILESRGHATQIERLKSQSIESSGKLKISEQVYDFTDEDLLDQGEIGHGNYGTVNKMYHERSTTLMAVKRIRASIDEHSQKQLLMDLDVVTRSNECPYIVKFFGVLFKEGDCWICMELMSTSLDQFYRFVHCILHQRIREDILSKIAFATLHALNYLKENLKIIHRDVKPSNILLDTSGNIKLCDFGISGNLVNSVARTREAGCRPYMAPERIDPKNFNQGYDVRSDVWSLGITLFEVSTGQFPYKKWQSIFDQLAQVVQGEAPRLDSTRDRFSPEFVDFVNTCLIKDCERRPKYIILLKHEFVRRAASMDIDVAGYVSRIVDQMSTHRMVSSAFCQ